MLERAKAHPALIIFDLNYQGVDALKLVQTLKADEGTKGISLIGYLSHVQGELKVKAQEAGCNAVMLSTASSPGESAADSQTARFRSSSASFGRGSVSCRLSHDRGVPWPAVH